MTIADIIDYGLIGLCVIGFAMILVSGEIPEDYRGHRN